MHVFVCVCVCVCVLNAELLLLECVGPEWDTRL